MNNQLPFSEVVHINKSSSPKTGRPGTVSLVGAGPGDPDLLTVKALKVIQAADLILFDRLVSQNIRDLFPIDTPAIYVGKAKDRHSIPQEELNQLIVDKALQGLNVCRLKGGDSLIFGRGSEEMLALKQAGVEVNLVPGITAASGCTSYAGIPLTHRGMSQGCTFVTAHAEKTLNINWSALAQLNHTVVFYMGLSSASMIQSKLLAEGMSSSMPMAFIENGCCPQQRVVVGDLGSMNNLLESENVQSPALIVVGETVRLSEQLDWFSTISQAELEKLSA